MKTSIFILLLIAAGLMRSYAAMHYDKAALVLHSVLDSPVNRNTNGMQDRWVARMNESVANSSEREHYRSMAMPASVWRTRGIGFAIAGGALLLGGSGLWLYADAETKRQLASGGRVYTSVYYLGAIMIGLVGLIFLAIGLPIWLIHLRG